MKNKAEKLRDLLCHAINILDKEFGIDKISEDIVLETDVFDKRSIILCSLMSYEELHVSIWWGYKLQDIPNSPSCHEPLSNLPKNKQVDVLVGGYVERKDGLWLQGDKSKHLYPKYCANSAQKDLEKIPAYKSSKILRTGKFYF